MQSLGIGNTQSGEADALSRQPMSCQKGCLIILLVIIVPLLIIAAAVKYIDDDCKAKNPGARCGDPPSDYEIMERERKRMEQRGQLPPSR